jgi:hypothetical protein
MSDEISEEGRRQRFARWEQLGVDQVKHDLLNGGHRLVGGPPAVRELAWEWVRMKETGAQVKESNIQDNAFELLKAIERATRGSATPVVLEELRDLGMTVDETKAAFQYLKSKGLIEAKFGIFYSARLSGAGHDAIQEAEKAAEQKQSAAPPPEKSSELLTLKPSIWGVSVDLKEAGRRIRQRLQRGKDKG